MKVECELFAEKTAGYVALWADLDPATHTGYRLKAISNGTGGWQLNLERVEGGVAVVVGSTTVTLEEAWWTFSLEVAGGKLHGTLGPAEKSVGGGLASKKGHVGIEGEEFTDFGVREFTVNGELLDSLRRSEETLSNGGKWTALAWTETSGRCFSEEFGWVPGLALGGAYWNPAEYEGDGGEVGEGGEEPATRMRSGVVRYALD